MYKPEAAAADAHLGRRERKKLQTKERLLDCAVDLFTSQGYDATTMEDIGECADVSRATMYNYFARKDDIVTEVFRRRRAAVAKLVSEANEATTDAADRLRYVLLGWARIYEENPETGRAMVRAWLRAGYPLMSDAWDSAALLADILRAGQNRGDIRPDIDADQAGLVLLDVYLGAIYRWVANEDDQENLQKNVAAMLDVVLNGLTAKRTSTRPRQATGSRQKPDDRDGR